MRINSLLALSMTAALLAACKGEPNTDVVPSEQGLTLTSLDSKGVSRSIKANFIAPAGDGALVEDGVALPLLRAKTPAQAELSASMYDYYYPFYEYWQYKDLQPHPELYCDEPVDGEFADIAKSLGGFRKTTSIHIDQDATAATVMSGWMVDSFLNRFALETADGGGANVTIQRPNVVGRSGSKAFYQSDVYGLITVDFANVPQQEPKVSCALPLPGQPKNFVVTDDNLYVIIQDTASMSSGVIQFDVSGDLPTYVKGIVLKDQDVIDARLFNDTLVMYLKTYAPIEAQPEQIAPPVNADISGDAFIGGITSLPRYTREYVYHELLVMKTLPVLEVSNRESFVPEGSEAPVLAEAPDPEALYTSRHFNNFLSASSEYLLVTENIRERHFVEYETKSYYRCDEHKVTDVPYHYCRTNWKRIENPDYSPPPSSGVIACTGKLADCLKTEGPKVSRYISVADGQQCHDGIRKKYSCIAGSTVTYEVPIYRWENKTQVYAFRFQDNTFVRLDDQLAIINKDNAIEAVDRNFVVDGRVKKHDHMQFNGDNLYIVSSKASNTSSEIDLHTLTIAGNSPVYVNQLSLSGQKYSNLSVSFTDDSIYLSDGRSSNSSSTLSTLSLANPLAPVVNGDVKIATSLSQLFFAGDGLLGIGSTIVRSAGEVRRHVFGTISQFDNNGTEQNSLLLGSDYRAYATNAAYDDQIVTIDHLVNRLFLPYQVSAPFPGSDLPWSQNRLTVANFGDNQLVEEGTIELIQPLHRTMSIDEDTAFGFSREFIHELSFDEGLKGDIIFDGELPDSIYYSRNSPTQVQTRSRSNSINFRLIDSAEAASGTLLDEVTIPKAASVTGCFNAQLLKDRDRIVYISEKPGLYFVKDDCPLSDDLVEKVYTGYRISDNKFVRITDIQEMESLRVQSKWDMVCITDTNNDDGELVKGFDIDATEALDCFTRQQFMAEIDQKINELISQ